eukprot:m.257178 g.257178  ORF g.257178 m.257178 type:complete len:355 (+) comp35032_c0_seq1:67-1131(+)
MMMNIFVCLTIMAVTAFAIPSPSVLPPKLAAMVEHARTDPAGLAKALKDASASTIAQEIGASTNPHVHSDAMEYPIVVTHGMGDSCFNAGMKSITKQSGAHAGVYATCIPTGDNDIEDTLAGFLLNMDKSVEVFARKVRADPKLANGFNAFGLSQGNNLIHGYQLKYNDPPVISFISICGINGGVGAFPNCIPDAPVIGPVCEVVTEVLGVAADTQLVQDVLFQANYFRDPVALGNESYKKFNQLAQWNGEGVDGTYNTTFKDNFLKTTTNVWVKGLLDTVVWPRESEWWGTPDPSNPFNGTVLTMKQTAWYQQDTFGLKTATEQNKTFFESFEGEHIRMTEAELFAWISKYFK